MTQTRFTYTLTLDSNLDLVIKNFEATLKDEKIVETVVRENKLIVTTEKIGAKKVLLG
jgi:hypothetical protein